MLAGSPGVVAIYTNCQRCQNSYPLGRHYDIANRLCSTCAAAKRREDAKTALADELVRGKSQ